MILCRAVLSLAFVLAAVHITEALESNKTASTTTTAKPEGHAASSSTTSAPDQTAAEA